MRHVHVILMALSCISILALTACADAGTGTDDDADAEHSTGAETGSAPAPGVSAEGLEVTHDPKAAQLRVRDRSPLDQARPSADDLDLDADEQALVQVA